MARVEILKTYKLYIGGKFPRTESGRYYQPEINKNTLGNICRASRKDFRNAVVAARKGFGAWSGASAFNRSQVIYRMAEMLEGRSAQFIDELQTQGSTKANAIKEVEQSIDRIIYYAGWCDKFTQVFSSINPVASSHFNFSSHEPMGVVAVLAPEEGALLGLISSILPVIAGGNTCIVLAAENTPLCAISFAEVLATSDLPAGVINILTGSKKELIPHFASHMDVNAIYYCGNDSIEIKEIQEMAVDNLKRVVIGSNYDLEHKSHEAPYSIIDFQEVKTTWHPIEVLSGAGNGY